MVQWDINLQPVKRQGQGGCILKSVDPDSTKLPRAIHLKYCPALLLICK